MWLGVALREQAVTWADGGSVTEPRGLSEDSHRGEGGSIRLADDEGKVILAEPTSVSDPDDHEKKQELCLRQQLGTLPSSPPHPESQPRLPRGHAGG